MHNLDVGQLTFGYPCVPHAASLSRVLDAGLPQNSASQKAAALTAIAALSKRLTGGASIASFTDNRGHSPPRYCTRMDHMPSMLGTTACAMKVMAHP